MMCKRVLQGFTLIEVLLALSVFSLAGLALLDTADTHFNSLNNLENKMIADWVASNQLVEASLDETWPPKDNKTGKVDMAGREWFWTQKVIKTQDNNMRSIVIEVRQSEKSELALTSLMTYVSKGT
ncbi:type II secretion system minor pseudopilin GspI [Colwellia sp. 1_MG-2023]|uniref:type II secretion system minor pseudopilin GspI n=1 Tax=Colwellia sp. 1_MG-2023 TaxID=3062649 RepID=UPI0026E464A3|nr:type II secretion system minor pseudopilin GspI [Colwellia sp. 1_MG-2023]MDO6447435.1 type II secretion system minor pseudopilin GspI [Colwellia sp. 1_MG-2023]